MAVRTAPATVVICARLRRGAAVREQGSAVRCTRVVDLDTLVADGPGGDGGDLALEIDPRWLASRQAVRRALVRARHAAPGLAAAVLQGVALEHHGVFAEEGIRAIVVDEFAAVARGPRRPAPAGWPCRNVAWGVWEVRACPPRRRWGWLPGWRAPRAGGLHVATSAADDARLGDWAARAVQRHRAVAVTLAELPAILEGRTTAPLTASVLRAA